MHARSRPVLVFEWLLSGPRRDAGGAAAARRSVMARTVPGGVVAYVPARRAHRRAGGRGLIRRNTWCPFAASSWRMPPACHSSRDAAHAGESLAVDDKSQRPPETDESIA